MEYFFKLKNHIESKKFDYEDLRENFFNRKTLSKSVKFEDKKLLPINEIITAIKPRLEKLKYWKARLQEIFKFLTGAKLQIISRLMCAIQEFSALNIRRRIKFLN